MNSVFSIRRDIPHLREARDALFRNRGSDTKIDAGVTYLAQFLAHEIVGSHRNNIFRTPTINMESLYGSSQFRASYQDKDGYFELGSSSGADRRSPDGLDIPLSKSNDVNIADIRNDENVFISQMHLLWMRLHNELLKEECQKTTVTNGDAQQNVRSDVTKIFKMVVINELLKNCLHPKVFEAYQQITQADRLISTNDLTVVPAVFSHAAFRFGHSMIREKYILQEGADGVKLHALLRHRPQQSNDLHIDRRLSKDFLVNWNLFFHGSESCFAKNVAMQIDLNIVNGMQCIPIDHDITGVRQAFPEGVMNVAELNLKANYTQSLPTALEIFNVLQNTPTWIKLKEQVPEFSLYRPENIEIREDFQFYNHSDMPLWLFVLNEAGDILHGQGIHLGTLASILVIEVIINALNGPEDDFWHKYTQNKRQIIDSLNAERFKDTLDSCGSDEIRMHHIIKYCEAQSQNPPEKANDN